MIGSHYDHGCSAGLFLLTNEWSSSSTTWFEGEMTKSSGARPLAICSSISKGIIQISKPYLGVKINSKVEFEFKTIT